MNIMLSDIKQTQKDNCYMIKLKCEIFLKMKLKNIEQKQRIDSWLLGQG
jgi:hypothetical protein